MSINGYKYAKVTQFADATESIDLWEFLALSSSNGPFDFNLRLGAEAFETGVQALRLPRAKWKERLVHMEKEKSRPLTRRETAQAKWNLYTTNLSAAQASAESIQKIYGLRWQVELQFKSLNLALSADVVKGAHSSSVAKAYIMARLTCAAILLGVRAIIAPDASRDIGLLRWMRRVAKVFTEIRDLIAERQWLALALMPAKMGVKHSLAEKHSKPSSR